MTSYRMIAIAAVCFVGQPIFASTLNSFFGLTDTDSRRFVGSVTLTPQTMGCDIIVRNQNGLTQVEVTSADRSMRETFATPFAAEACEAALAGTYEYTASTGSVLRLSSQPSGRLPGEDIITVDVMRTDGFVFRCEVIK